jgi:hypothetical protein
LSCGSAPIHRMCLERAAASRCILCIQELASARRYRSPTGKRCARGEKEERKRECDFPFHLHRHLLDGEKY